MNIEFSTIGTIHSPFAELSNMPIQPVGAKDVEGEVVVHDKYTDGLDDLEGFSHIYLIYYLHKTSRIELKVIPFMDTKAHGIFATRSPLRPCPIGISIVKLISRTGNRLRIQGVDVLDNTPLLDIKPYITQFDQQENVVCGWMTSSRKDVEAQRSDTRFCETP